MDHAKDDYSSSELGDGIRLILLLGEDLSLSVLDGPLTESIDVEGRRFESLDGRVCTGFYDCLWDPDGQIVGIGYFPDDDLAFLGEARTKFLDRVNRSDYARTIKGPIVNILLGKSSSLDTAEWGGEQEFEEFRVFPGEAGQFAISLRSSYITRSDVERFLSSGVRPVSLEVRS